MMFSSYIVGIWLKLCCVCDSLTYSYIKLELRSTELPEEFESKEFWLILILLTSPLAFECLYPKKCYLDMLCC